MLWPNTCVPYLSDFKVKDSDTNLFTDGKVKIEKLNTCQLTVKKEKLLQKKMKKTNTDNRI